MTPTPTLTGQDIAEAQGAVRALLDAVLDGTGTSSNEYVVLRVLAAREPSTQAALHAYLVDQRQLGLSAEAAGDLLANLRAAGLVTGASVDDPGPVELTPVGNATLADLGSRVAGTTRRLYADFDPAELATTHRVLTNVIERANQIRDEL